MKPQPCVCRGSALPLSHVASPLAAFLTPEFYLRMKRRDQRHTIGLLCADHYDALSFFISQRFYFYLNVGACRSQQRAPGLPALQGSVNCPMPILGTELRFSERAASTPEYAAITIALWAFPLSSPAVAAHPLPSETWQDLLYGNFQTQNELPGITQ